jgi:hypothetical protein
MVSTTVLLELRNLKTKRKAAILLNGPKSMGISTEPQKAQSIRFWLLENTYCLQLMFKAPSV